MANKQALLEAAHRAHKSGNLRDAEDLSRRVLELDPDDLRATLLLGVIEAKSGRFADSIERLSLVVAKEPRNVAALDWLTLALREGGAAARAVAVGETSARLQPQNPEAAFSLGMCLVACKRFQDAAECFQRAISLRPLEARYHFGFASALERLGFQADARTAWRSGIGIAPTTLALLRLGNLSLELGDPDESLSCATGVLQSEPHNGDAQLLAARALREANRSEDAEIYLSKIIQADPNRSGVRIVRAFNFQAQGRFAEAAAEFRKSVELEPSQGFGYYGLASAKKLTEADAGLLEQMEELLANESMATDEAAYLNYALGKALEDIGKYQQSFERYEEANRLTRELKSKALSFDPEELQKETTRTIHCCTPEFFETGAESQPSTCHPIFIVCMPRSGTTLVEQVLSSHPLVGAAGEQPFWAVNSPQLFAHGDCDLDGESLSKAAVQYSSVLSGAPPGKSHVTDKNPANFMFLGPILRALPNAKIVHMRRDPADTALSIYVTPMRTPPQFACDQSNIAFAYRQYLRLMDHWRAVLPAWRMLDVDYEELVEHPELVTRRMVEFCGLNWDDACLAPERNLRTVRTPSFWQVRQPLYRTSCGRWKRFERWIPQFVELRETP